jgi:hypothetical protein
VFFLNILCSFGTFFPILVSCTNKNLATLLPEKRGSNLRLLSQKYSLFLICRQKDFLDALSTIYNGVISGGQYYDQNFPRFAPILAIFLHKRPML